MGTASAVLSLLKAKAFRIAGVVAMGALMAACASPKPKSARKSHGKEYFAESKYGVKASPRIVGEGRKIPRGGGRYQVGKPYQVAGRWYYPKEEPGYVRKGKASWYGAAFHGRLTANGEVYDTNHLTAAHPTMPLPSYARVTNMANGSSVVVRVNDRGPYHGNRVIDLSQRAASMLDYQHTGTADVKVEYVGRAPLDGADESFLMASYRGPGAGDPYGQPASGVMIAMNGATPTSKAAVAIPGMAPQPAAGVQVASLDAAAPSLDYQASSLAGTAQSQPAVDSSGLNFTDADPVLPLIGPFVADKPAIMIGTYKEQRRASALVSSYADERIAAANSASAALEAAIDPAIDPAVESATWKRLARLSNLPAPEGEYVDLGLFEDRAEALRLSKLLQGLGNVSLSEVASPQGMRTALVARARDAAGNDALLRAAWNAGAEDAFVVRDDR
ncbi:septal ring lytic transglycosylase RlpA family protein [Phyllobacterium sp. 21LDTY02-6]|nr:septal ring lytic transglycosylase RlpA family protein [Phyllobacterium sp. 21LDTY02-6]